MPNCHNCPENGTKSKACLKCEGPAERLTDAGSHVSLHECPEKAFQAIPQESDQYDIARSALRLIISLPWIDREIVIRRLHGDSYSHIRDYLSATFGKLVTVQALHVRIVRLVKRDSIYAEIFEAMVLRQRKRKPHSKQEAGR
jgi:hypothetical protein